MFRGMRVRGRLSLLVAAVVLAVGASGVVSGRSMYHQLFEDRVEMLRAIVQGASGVADDLHKEVVAGSLSRDAALEQFRRSLKGFVYGESDYILAFDREGTLIAHPNPKLLGVRWLSEKGDDRSKLAQAMFDSAKATGEGTLRYDFPRPGATERSPKLAYLKMNENLGILIGTGVYIDDLDAKFEPLAWMLAAATILIALLATGVTAFVGRTITGPLSALEGRMRAIADGALDSDIPEAERTDEIGAMARAVRVFQNNAKEKLRLETETAESARRAETTRQETLRRLAAAFEGTVGNVILRVSNQAGTMETRARTVVDSTERTTLQATAASAATEQTSVNVQEVASASEELSATIAEIARQVNDSGRIAGEAVSRAQNANSKVEGLAEAVQRIGAVVGLINSIASQTNLLALNATIEAARAGEAGKGFAVVASEVKTLANQTAKATEDIAAQVAAIQSATAEAVGEIKSVVAVIERVNGIATGIASAVEEQGAATAEIARNVQQAARGAQEVSSSISGLSGAAGESGRAARDILDGARELAGQTEALNREVASFLQTVRAA